MRRDVTGDSPAGIKVLIASTEWWRIERAASMMLRWMIWACAHWLSFSGELTICWSANSTAYENFGIH